MFVTALFRYHCHTCKMVDSIGVCTVCAKVCHKDHDLSYAKFGSFFCDCGAKEDGTCQVSVKVAGLYLWLSTDFVTWMKISGPLQVRDHGYACYIFLDVIKTVISIKSYFAWYTSSAMLFSRSRYVFVSRR